MNYFKRVALMVVMVLAPCAALAQAVPIGMMNDDIPRLEFGLNYNFVRANAPPGQCGCFSLNGGAGVFQLNLTPKWAAIADVSVLHAGNVDNTGQDITLIHYLFGARYSKRNHTRFVPYGQVLFGGAKEDVNFQFTINRNAFGLSGGGGVTTRLSRKFDLNIVQIEYVHTRVPNGQNDSQNDTRVSTGVFYKF
jgi:outer membrane immunogenic protein